MEKADFERRLRRILSEYLSTTNTRTMTPVVRVLSFLCVLISETCSYELDDFISTYSSIHFFYFRENTFCRFSFSYMEEKIGVKQGYLLTRRTKQLLVCMNFICKTKSNLLFIVLIIVDLNMLILNEWGWLNVLLIDFQISRGSTFSSPTWSWKLFGNTQSQRLTSPRFKGCGTNTFCPWSTAVCPVLNFSSLDSSC